MSPNTMESNVPTIVPLKKRSVPESVSMQYEEPPDGGCRAYLVVAASFLANGLIFGVINSLSVIVGKIQDDLEDQNGQNASSRAALVGSLAIGATFFMSIAAGIMTDTFGIRRTAIIGSCLATLGMFASAFCTTVEALYFTFGIMFGVGASLTYTPSLVILGQYFKKYLGIANGVVTAGSPILTQVILFSQSEIISNYGQIGCFYFFGALMLLLVGCALIFKPLNLPKARKSLPKQSQCAKIINLKLFQRKRYIVWTAALPLGFLGYFVHFVHVVKFVETSFQGSDGKWLITCLQITSFLGRIIFGIVSDLPRVNRLLLQQLSLVFLGVFTISMAYANSFGLLIAISLGMGLFDGCLISYIGPVAFDLCGEEGASQAIGFLFGICSIPMTVGPYLAGYLYDRTQSYTLSYGMSGLFFISAAIIMCLIWCLKDPPKERCSSKVNDIECEAVKPLYKEIAQESSLPSYKDIIKTGHLTGSNGIINYTEDENPSI